jgi:hypothetical protein
MSGRQFDGEGGMRIVLVAAAAMLTLSFASSAEVTSDRTLALEQVGPGECVVTCLFQIYVVDPTHTYTVAACIGRGVDLHRKLTRELH